MNREHFTYGASLYQKKDDALMQDIKASKTEKVGKVLEEMGWRPPEQRTMRYPIPAMSNLDTVKDMAEMRQWNCLFPENR